MNFTCERDALAPWLKRVSLLADAKSPVPVYACVRMAATTDLLYLTAGHTAFQITVEIPVIVKQQGEVCVPVQHFADLVGSLRTDQPISLTHADGLLRLQSGHTKAQFATIDPAGVSVFAPVLPLPQITVSAGELDRVLRLTIPAMGTDQDRVLFLGLSLQYNKDGIIASAMNGSSFGAVATLHHQRASEFPAVIVPRPVCIYLRTLLKGVGGDIEISISTGNIRVAAADWIILSRQIQGSFPPPAVWGAKRVEQPLVVRSDEFAGILARIDAAVDYDAAKLKQRGALLTVANGVLTVRDSHSTISDLMDVDCQDEHAIGINTMQLRHAIANLDSPEVELHFTSREKPICVCVKGEPIEAYTTSSYRIA